MLSMSGLQGLYRERIRSLPPIALESASSVLPSGSLAEFSQRASTSPRSASGSRRLQSISRFGHRANERVAEADVEFSAHDRQEAQGLAIYPDQSVVNFGQLMDLQKQSFDQVIAGINAALSNDAGPPAKTVKKDETISEVIPPHVNRVYRIPLPSRPVAVVVALKMISGSRCTMWGSTSTERPSVRNYDYKGKDDKLVYEHANRGDDEENRGSDVPSARDLWVTVEPDGGEAAFKLSVSFGPVKISLSRAEIASRVQQMRRGWETKLAELRRDRNARELFDERVRQLKEERKQKFIELHGTADYVGDNMKVEEYVRERPIKMQRLALKNKDRQMKAEQAREEIEKRHEAVSRSWLAKKGRLTRQASINLDPSFLERQQLAKQWAMLIPSIFFIARLERKTKEKQQVLQTSLLEVKAAETIRRFWLKHLAAQMQLRLNRAHHIVKTFLETYAFNKEVPTLAGTLRSFRGHVVLIQRKFRQVVMIRQAYVTVFLPDWFRVQNKIMESMILTEEQKQAEQESRAIEALRSVEGGTKNNLIHRRTITLEKADPRQTIQREMPPERVIRDWLFEYVRQMQLSRPSRIKKWQDEMQQQAYHKDLAKFGVHEEGDDALTKPWKVTGCPASVYKDQAEIESLVNTRVNEWLNGHYQHIKANRHRLLSKTFFEWERLNRAMKEEAPDIMSVPKRKPVKMRKAWGAGARNSPRKQVMSAFITETTEMAGEALQRNVSKRAQNTTEGAENSDGSDSEGSPVSRGEPKA